MGSSFHTGIYYIAKILISKPVSIFRTGKIILNYGQELRYTQPYYQSKCKPQLKKLGSEERVIKMEEFTEKGFISILLS